MKSKFIALLALCSFALTAKAQCSLLDKYSDKKGVEYVYISKAMMKMIGGANITGDLPLNGNVLGMIDCIQIVSYDGSSKELMTAMKEDAAKFIKNSEKENYELLLKTKEDGSVTTILSKEEKEGKKKNEFLLISVEETECSFIYIAGSLSSDDFQKYAGKAGEE